MRDVLHYVCSHQVTTRYQSCPERKALNMSSAYSGCVPGTCAWDTRHTLTHSNSWSFCMAHMHSAESAAVHARCTVCCIHHVACSPHSSKGHLLVHGPVAPDLAIGGCRVGLRDYMAASTHTLHLTPLTLPCLKRLVHRQPQRCAG